MHSGTIPRSSHLQQIRLKQAIREAGLALIEGLTNYHWWPQTA
jgi:hypothetical protein